MTCSLVALAGDGFRYSIEIDSASKEQQAPGFQVLGFRVRLGWGAVHIKVPGSAGG